MSSSEGLLHIPRHVLKLRFRLQARPLLRVATRSFATVQAGSKNLPIVWFNGSIPLKRPPNHATNSYQPPDERTVKLGKSKCATHPSFHLPTLRHIFKTTQTDVFRLALRILQARLPTLLQSPLPSEILSPQISLHLFPSTHPYLPTVSGRVAYIAALWTSPIAWGRVPIVGNVKLEILSERMVRKNPGPLTSSSSLASSGSGSGHGVGYRSEQLVVRWRTVGKTRSKAAASEQVDKITEFLGGGGTVKDDSKEFTGLFIFEFDEEGRILRHIIEHVQEGGNWEKGVGARVVGLTDWLLGGLKGKGEGEGTGTPCPAFWHVDREQRR